MVIPATSFSNSYVVGSVQTGENNIGGMFGQVYTVQGTPNITLKNLYADVIRGDKTYKLLKGELSESEKANIRKARTEIGIFIMLTLLIRLFGTADDKKGKWGQRMALYQLKRLELETGASIPWLSIIENFFTIAKSPVPSTDSFEGLIDLLKFWNIFDEIESGPYQGWSEYARDAFRATPVLPQVKRVIDVANEDYLFNIYNK